MGAEQMKGKIVALKECTCGYVLLMVEVEPLKEDPNPIERLIEKLKTDDSEEAKMMLKMYQLMQQAIPDAEKGSRHHKVEIPVAQDLFNEADMKLGDEIRVEIIWEMKPDKIKSK